MDRVLICGGRDFNDRDYVFSKLDELFGDHEALTIIQGGARGADSLARDWAIAREHSVQTFKAEWDKYGKMAGAIRNEKMLREGDPELVIAFPGGTGTAHMAKIAKRNSVRVEHV